MDIKDLTNHQDKRELFESRTPNFNGIDTSKMSGDEFDGYYMLYSAYNNLLYSYLKTNTSINSYDEKLAKSNIGFQEVPKEERDFYQDMARYFKYFYIRSNLHIERLSRSDLEIIQKAIIERDFKLDEAKTDLIKRTLRNVIFEEVRNNEIITINYGPDTPMYYVPNNTLVLGLRYDDNLPDYSEETLKLSNKRHEFSIAICNNVSTWLSKELGMSVACLPYSSNSVIKKKPIPIRK